MKRKDLMKMAAAAGAAFTISAVAGFSVMSGAFGTSDTAYASENTGETVDHVIAEVSSSPSTVNITSAILDLNSSLRVESRWNEAV